MERELCVDSFSLPTDCNEEYIHWIEVMRCEKRVFSPSCVVSLQTQGI